MRRVYSFIAFGLISVLPAMGSEAALAAPPSSGAKHATPRNAATTPQQLGKNGSWTAYAYKEKGGRVCYLVGTPEKAEPVGVRRKNPTAMVTHRPDEKVENVVSFVEGAPLREGSNVTLESGTDKFELFTKGDSAWAKDADLDKSVVTALAKGKQVVVRATPVKGKGTTDTYSLAGFSQALGLIDKSCGVKR